jgi:hypothetical protein
MALWHLEDVECRVQRQVVRVWDVTQLLERGGELLLIEVGGRLKKSRARM